MNTLGYLRAVPGFIVLLGVALAGSSLLVVPTAQAQDAYRCIEELSEDELDYRIDKIQQNFEDGKAKSSAWRFGWMTAAAGITTLSIYNLLIRQSPKAERFFEYALLAGGAATVLQFAVIPMPGVYGAKRIRKKPGKTIEEKRVKLRYATKTLEKAAKVQGFLGSELYGGGGVIYGLVMGSVYLGLYHDDIGALPTRKERVLARLRATGLYLIPPILTIAQAISHPKNSYYLWEDYRQTACSRNYYDSGPTGPEFDLSINPMDITFRISF